MVCILELKIFFFSIENIPKGRFCQINALLGIIFFLLVDYFLFSYNLHIESNTCIHSFYLSHQEEK